MTEVQHHHATNPPPTPRPSARDGPAILLLFFSVLLRPKPLHRRRLQTRQRRASLRVHRGDPFPYTSTPSSSSYLQHMLGRAARGGHAASWSPDRPVGGRTAARGLTVMCTRRWLCGECLTSTRAHHCRAMDPAPDPGPHNQQKRATSQLPTEPHPPSHHHTQSPELGPYAGDCL